LSRFVRFTLFVLALLAACGIVAGGVWYVLSSPAAGISGTAASPSSVEVQLPESLEQTLLALYLQTRWAEVTTAASSDARPVAFSVKPGEAVGDIAVRLQRLGLIKDAELFRLVVRYRGADARLQAGDFTLRANMTMDEIIVALQHSQQKTVKIVIPEGWRAEEIAAALEKQGVVRGDVFLAAVANGKYDYSILADRPKGVTSVEGYLAPDTYQIPGDFDAPKLVDFLVRTFDQKFTPAMRQSAQAQKLSVFQAVTLASIVEREALRDDERALIASVYLNRLRQGMHLQADPTVQYALGYQKNTGQWWKSPLSLEEYSKVDSPYNTYLYKGLPPGPIANPSLKSLQAVVQPAKTEYLFFLAKGDGSHAFAKTYEEHEANLKKYGYQK